MSEIISQISQGVTRSAISSITINNLPQDINLQVEAVIEQNGFCTYITGAIPKTMAPRMKRKPFLKRLFSREKYYYFPQPRGYIIHSPNGFPFNCQWKVSSAQGPPASPKSPCPETT